MLVRVIAMAMKAGEEDGDGKGKSDDEGDNKMESEG